MQKTGFEEREDGFVWYGGPEGHFPINHSHVVLTEKNGWTVGTYLSGGRWYEIRADSAGAGVVTADSTDEPPHWCGAKPPSAPVMPHLPLGSAASSTRDRRPSSVGSPAYDPLAPPAEIDIVISVSKEAEKYFDEKSSVDAEVQAIVDYASLVLKNSFESNSWFVAPVVRPVAVVGDLFDNIDGLNGEPYELALKHMTRLHALRREHNADIVHIITKSRIYDALGVCGVAPILLRGETAEENVQYAFSITDVNCDQASPGRSKRTFIHEIGHNLGLNHNVETGTANDRSSAFGAGRTGYGWLSNPWATDKTSPFDPIPSASKPGAYTVMAYKPRSSGGVWHGVPFFSTAAVRLRPGKWGLPASVDPPDTRWRLGHKRLAHSVQTIPEAAQVVERYSDYQFRLSKAPRDLRITDSSRTVAYTTDSNVTYHTLAYDLEWRDDSNDETAFVVGGGIFKRVWKGSRFVKGPEARVLPNKRLPADTERATVSWTVGEGWVTSLDDENMLVLWVSSLNQDGKTASEEVIAPKIVPPPTAPVLSKPRFTWLDWCIDIEANRNTTEKLDVRVSWVGPHYWDYGNKNSTHPGSLGVYCHKKIGVGYKFDVKVVAVNSKGRAESNLLTFRVPEPPDVVPTAPVIGDHVFRFPSHWTKRRGPGDWCAPITIDESNTRFVRVRVEWTASGGGTDSGWYERPRWRFYRGKLDFCWDGDVGETIKIYAVAYSRDDWRNSRARSSRSQEKTFFVDH